MSAQDHPLPSPRQARRDYQWEIRLEESGRGFRAGWLKCIERLTADGLLGDDMAEQQYQALLDAADAEAERFIEGRF